MVISGRTSGAAVMDRSKSINVQLSPEQSDLVRAAVEGGSFASPEEAVSEAVETWRESRLIFGYTPEQIAALVAEGEASGEPVDGELAFERIKMKLESHITSKVS
jgi:antitoxin ParD1/3/4